MMAFDDNEPANQHWNEIMAKKLKTATAFEIHCWTEETEEITMALPFGTFKESTWQYGKIIEGKVTPEFTSFLLGLPKPTDTEIYNKMTPFFTICSMMSASATSLTKMQTTSTPCVSMTLFLLRCPL